MTLEHKNQALVGLLLIILVGYVLLMISNSNRLEARTEKYKSEIGSVHVIDGDTLMIVDYSLFRNSFTLSNGVEVNFKLIVKEE